MNFHRITDVEGGAVFQGPMAVLAEWAELWQWYRSRGFRLNLPKDGESIEYPIPDQKAKLLISLVSGDLYHVRKVND